MYLCEDGHPEIVHDDGYNNWPLCRKIKEVEEMEDKIIALNDTIDELNQEIQELNKGD